MAPPRLDERSIVRTRLLGEDTTSPRPLVAIVAPAGYGKTTLAVQLVEGWPHTTVWLRLDSGDDDPARFWSALGVALATAGVDGAADVHPMLAETTASFDQVAATLRSFIEAHDQPLCLVLDDVHHLEHAEIVAPLAEWLHHPSPGLTIVATSRRDLPLPVGRLRTQGSLTEIRLDDLAFDAGETATLLETTFGVDGLTPEHTAALSDRTDGWPVGVYLAGLALRDGKNLDATIERFTGDVRHLSEYLAEEATDGLGDDERAFLLATSVLRHLDPDLCDEVTGQPGSLRTLRSLVADNVFTVALDDAGTMFQYHPLFREHLESTLRSEHPELVPELHRRASRWSQLHGMIDDAVHHATVGGDVTRAQRLIADSWLDFSRTGHFGTLKSWVNALGRHSTDSAEVCLMMGWGALNLHRWDDVDVWLGAAAAASGDAVLDQMVAVEAPIARAHVARHLGDVGRYLELALTGFDHHDDTFEVADPDLAERLATTGAITSGVLGSARLWTGDHDAARELLLAAAARSRLVRESTSTVDAYLHLALLEAEVGAPDEALAHADQGLSIVVPGTEKFMRPTLGHLARSIALRRLGRPGDAADALDQARQLVLGAAEPLHEAMIELEQARLHHLSGDLDAARSSLRQAEAIADALPDAQMDDRIRATRQSIRFVPRELSGLPVGARELTDRESAVLALLPHGLSRRELAAQLFVSENTVKTHLSSIRHKLGVEERGSVLDRALELGLVTTE